MNCFLFSLCKYGEGQMYLFYAQLLVLVITMLIGGWFVWWPKRVIEMQVAFYRRSNWKMEPISISKELKNTRTMGAIVLILGVVLLVVMIMMKA